MFGHSRIVGFTALLALLSPALATVYRVDSRSPQQIKDAGGFKAMDPAGTGSVIDHANNKLGDKDPWVSTTSDKGFAKDAAKGNLEAWLYHIKESGITFTDVDKAIKDAGEVNNHPAEKEQAVKGEIAWTSITGWDHYQRKKKVGDQSRKDFDDGQKDKKRSEPLVNSVKFKASL